MALALHRAAHHAEAHLRRAVGIHRKSRHDGVRRPLARAHLVGMAGLQHEAVAAVLQADAGARHHHARAEAHVVALDERDHHAAGVGAAQVHRAAGARCAVTGVAGLLAVDQRRAFGQVSGVQQGLRRHLHVVDVGVVAVQVGQGQLHRLDLQVHRVHMVDGQVVGAQRFQHAQRHQRGDALAVGRDLVHHRLAEALRQRAAPVGPVLAQVGFGHRAAVGLGEGGDLLGQRAAVEGFALGVGDGFQRAGVGLAAEDLTGARCPPFGQEALGKAGLAAQPLAAHGPQRGDDGRDRKAIPCIADGRRGHLGQRQLAEAARQLHPGRNGAGHGHRVPAGVGHGGAAGITVGRPGGRRAARGIEAVQLLAVPQDGEGIAADAAAGGLHHRQRHRGGHGGVHRIAAGQQHAQAGLRRQRVRGADHVAPQHRRAGGGVGLGPVEGVV